MKFLRKGASNEFLLSLYKSLLKPRLIEEKMLLLLRQGKISKWFSGMGQEALSIGMIEAIHPDEYILPMHRNLGVFTSRQIPLERLFAQFQGKKSGFTNGRDRSFHFGSKEHHIVGMISHLGSQMGVANGIALGEKLDGSNKLTVVITGDGGASQGDFHEALNVAAVWDLPVLILIENNGYGLSTPSNEQFRFKHFVDKGIGYGIEAHQVDGNNVLEVYQKVQELAEIIRKENRPMILECMTFRMRGHEEASGIKYIPKEVMELWAAYDPIDHYQNFLLAEGIIDERSITTIKEQIKKEIVEAWDISDKEAPITQDESKEISDLFMNSSGSENESSSSETEELRFIDGVSAGLEEAMIKHPNLILMGQDIAEYGGVFKVTEGFIEKFGKNRVRNTPLCEAAILGSALGLSVQGYKSMVEMQFADFVTEGFNQIVNNLAKSHWRWGQNADVVIRMPTGAGVNAGPFHSQSNEAWFFHEPGLKICYPAFPDDAKALLLTSFEDPNPILFFEHKTLYRSVKGKVPTGYCTIPFGKANLLHEGNELSIITYGMGVHWALKELESTNLSVDLIDLRTLVPLDTECIFESVKKTGRVLILHEDNLTGGIGAEIASQINEHCFSYLDAPVKRLASIDTPIPFADDLEKNYLPAGRLAKALRELLDY